ncbi:hypothetical protein TTRE_0000950101 [Trichuris trichiura]|uniref:Uncharacterized protein n=1 Tax=Trichuris trichiura TaxID=36087 RepID=A0A077ZMV1_TRITR|nr:hypothetical protein TTRE_0000950101 [Trichuris trichiura]
MQFPVAAKPEEVSASDWGHWCAVDREVHQCGQLTSTIAPSTEEAGLCLRVFTHMEGLFNHQRSMNADTSFAVQLLKAR